MTARLDAQSRRPSPDEPAQPAALRRTPFLHPRGRWAVLAVLSFLVSFTVLYGAYAALQLRAAYQHARALEARTQRLEQLLDDPDLSDLHAEVTAAQQDVHALEQALQPLGWARYAPGVGEQYQEGREILAAADHALTGAATLTEVLLPYEAELGLSKGTPPPPGEERLAALIQALEANRPALEAAAADLQEASRIVQEVDAERFPETLAGRPLRARIVDAQGALSKAAAGAGWLPLLPDLLGGSEPRRYFLLFQNDKEVRATGGFLTGYAYLELNEGRFSMTGTGDIYHLGPYTGAERPDLLRRLAPGSPLLRSLERLPIQDTNWSPDFPTAMASFERLYTQTGSPPFDGIIAVDTRLVEAILAKTGPISVEGYDEPFSVEPVTYRGAKLPQVVYQMELYAERLSEDRDTRKEILGDLADALIHRIMGMSVKEWRDIGEVVHDQARQRHLLFYLHDPEAQALIERYGFAGRVREYDGDYLMVVDANYGWNKANLFVQQEIHQRTFTNSDGTLAREVTITYKNPGPADRWLNGDPRYALRLYVPSGSSLVALEGGVLSGITGEEHGYTVFATVVSVPPGATTTVRVAYTLPASLTAALQQAGEYRLLLQRQPGTDVVPQTLDLFGTAQAFGLRYDTEIRAPYPGGPAAP